MHWKNSKLLRPLQVVGTDDAERGASMLEYMLLALLVVLAAVGSMQVVGQEVDESFRHPDLVNAITVP